MNVIKQDHIPDMVMYLVVRTPLPLQLRQHPPDSYHSTQSNKCVKQSYRLGIDQSQFGKNINCAFPLSIIKLNSNSKWHNKAIPHT